MRKVPCVQNARAHVRIETVKCALCLQHAPKSPVQCTKSPVTESREREAEGEMQGKYARHHKCAAAGNVGNEKCTNVASARNGAQRFYATKINAYHNKNADGSTNWNDHYARSRQRQRRAQGKGRKIIEELAVCEYFQNRYIYICFAAALFRFSPGAYIYIYRLERL